MKVEISREDFNEIRMAIATVKAILGEGYHMKLDGLSDRLNAAWLTAIQEDVLERIERERKAILSA